MRYAPYSRPTPRRGAIAVQVAVCFTALLSVTALAIDGGVVTAEKRHAQSTADAAALAPATQLYKNRLSITNGTPDPGGKAAASATAIAAANGYTSPNATVTVHIPPTSGNFVGQLGYAEVLVQYNSPRSFSALFGSGTLPVPARAVARERKPNVD